MIATLRMVFSDPCLNSGVGHIAASLCRHMNGGSLATHLLASTMSPDCAGSCFRAALPRWANGLPFRIIGGHARRRTERLYLESVKPGDTAYLWSCVSPHLLSELRRRNVPIIREKYNCHVATAQRILSEEYRRLGFSFECGGITNEMIEIERDCLHASDGVFSPSPCVTQSLVQEGVEADRIMESTYGWHPERFPDRRAGGCDQRSVTVLFVGFVCVRKGAHLLLDAWKKSRITGRLILCGPVEPAIANCCADLLNRGDVIVTGPQRDVGSMYRSADVFAFPSLEEGSPLVTFEAMAHGLPMLVSPMAAGSVVRSGVEGFVIPPLDVEAWVAALRKLSGNVELRAELGKSARARAEAFTWERVAARRREQILRRFNPSRAPKSELPDDDERSVSCLLGLAA